MSTTPTVAIIAPGNMGAGVGRRLTENKVTVLTSLAGRSEESVKRAREAGMQPVEERALAEADFFLSIVPPGDALACATRLVPVLTAANKKADLCRMQCGQPADDAEDRRCDRQDRLSFCRRRHHRAAAEARQHQHKNLRVRPGRKGCSQGSMTTG